jgi:hypothetical protein
MDTGQIKSLIDKYFEGNTTLVEEQQLRDYFNGDHEIPDVLAPAKNHFLLLDPASEYSQDIQRLKLKISNLIDNQNFVLNQPQRSHTLRWLFAAATVAILIGIAGMITYQKHKHASADTFSDPRIAYEEAKNTLLFVSSQMNEGIEPLSHVEKINIGAEKIQSLEKINTSFGIIKKVSYIGNSNTKNISQ